MTKDAIDYCLMFETYHCLLKYLRMQLCCSNLYQPLVEVVNFFTDVMSSVFRLKNIMLNLFFSGCNVFNIYIVVLFKLKLL